MTVTTALPTAKTAYDAVVVDRLYPRLPIGSSLKVFVEELADGDIKHTIVKESTSSLWDARVDVLVETVHDGWNVTVSRTRGDRERVMCFSERVTTLAEMASWFEDHLPGALAKL